MMSRFILGCAATAVLLVAGRAEAAAYIKFEGIDGEARDAAHEGWSDVLEYGIEITRPAGDVGGGRGRPAAVPSPFRVSKEVDKASPKLFEGLIRGTTYPSVELSVTGPVGGGGLAEYVNWELRNAIIVSYETAGTAESRSQETVALGFEEITYKYTEYGDDGQAKGTIEATWRIEAGAPIAADVEIEGDVDHFVLDTGTLHPVPEPSGVVLAGLGLLGLWACARRKRRA